MAKRNQKNKKSRKQLREENIQVKRMRWLRMGGIVILAVAVLAIFVYYRASTAPSVNDSEGISAANIAGAAGAPVRIVEFGDFGCPSCRAWHNSGIKEALLTEYGEQISFTFRHFPVITRQSPQAAEASQCASEQGQFWAFHDYIYEQTPIGALATDELKSYAGAIGLDQSQFDACLDSGTYSSYVSRDQQAALAAGARGTPSFFINGQPMGFSFESMAASIEQAINEQS